MLALLLVAAAATHGESQFFLPGDREAVYAFVERGNDSPHRSALQALYRFTGYQFLWIRNAKPTAQALALVARLETAEQKGLRPEDYDGPLWAERIERMGHPAQFDVVLSSRVIRYVSDLSRGRINPGATADDESELGFLVYRLSHAPDVDPPLAAAEPALPSYRRSLEALQAYLRLAARDDGVRVRMPRQPVEPGGKYAGAAQLAHRLRFLGDLPVYGIVPAKSIYAGDLVKAVERFQSRHGLAATGRLDARTVRLLNVPLERRIAQLRLTLERLRWLPRSSSPASPPLIVNIPEFRLHAGRPDAFSTRIVVGRGCRHRTALLAAALQSVIFRPYWDVPRKVTETDLLPALENDPSIVARNGYEIVERDGTLVTADAPTPETLAQLRDGLLRIRQRPGVRSALGAVKFAFPSRSSVYMYGSPPSGAFAGTGEDLRRGCIRVEDPEGLARWVLRKDPAWTPERIRSALNGSATVRADLKEPVPVLILYSTAVVSEDGEVHFFEDVYGLDRKLSLALGEASGV